MVDDLEVDINFKWVYNSTIKLFTSRFDFISTTKYCYY